MGHADSPARSNVASRSWRRKKSPVVGRIEKRIRSQNRSADHIELRSSQHRRRRSGASAQARDRAAGRSEEVVAVTKFATVRDRRYIFDPMKDKEFELKRDLEVILIPAGQKYTIPAGTKGVITQALGGNYTIATQFGLSQVAENDLDALGLEKPTTEVKENAARSNGEVSEDEVWNQLKQCYDPEIPVNIVDLGLVYDCRLTKKDDGGTKVEVKMTLTSPGCGM